MQCPLIPAMKELVHSLDRGHRIFPSDEVGERQLSGGERREVDAGLERPAAPVMTTTRTPLRAATVATTSPSSAAKRALPAFSTAGRSNVMRAIGPRTVQADRRLHEPWGIGCTIRALVSP